MEYKKGRTHFIILGDGKLADIVELSLESSGKSDLEYRRVSRLEEIKDDRAVILLANNKPQIKADLKSRAHRWIDILSTISGS